MSLIKKFLNNKKLFRAMVFVMLITVFFVKAKFTLALAPGDVASAGGQIVLGAVGSALVLVLGIIAYILTAVIGMLITVVVALLIQVAQFNNIINVPTVIQGWVIIRDLCNMSFILILLIIAFATILRQENFSAKKMLPKLLLMAILINFSRSIFGLLIDVSQVIMLTFVNAFAAGGGWFINAFRIDLLLSIREVKTASDIAVTTWSTAVAIIAGVLAAIITLIVVSVILAVLVARVVMLWIYTIFSPLIFLGFAFTPLQKYTGKLWEDFTKQLVVGPVLAFFIWLALTTAQSSSSSLLSGQKLAGDDICVGAGAFFCGGNFQNFVIVIGLLMGGLMVAQSMGGAAGSIAGKGLDWAKKSLAAPVKMGKAGLDRIGDKIHKETHFDPNLVRAWHGWNEKRKDNAAKRYRGNVSKAGEALTGGSMLGGIAALTGAPEDAWNQIASFKGWKERLIAPGGGLKKLAFWKAGGKGRQEAITAETGMTVREDLTKEIEGDEKAPAPGTIRYLEKERSKMMNQERFDKNELELKNTDEMLNNQNSPLSIPYRRNILQPLIVQAQADVQADPTNQDKKDKLNGLLGEGKQLDNEERIYQQRKKNAEDAKIEAKGRVSSQQEFDDIDNTIAQRKKDRDQKILEESEKPGGRLYGTLEGFKVRRNAVWTLDEAKDNELKLDQANTSLTKNQIDQIAVKQKLNMPVGSPGGPKNEEEKNSLEERRIKYEQIEKAIYQEIRERTENKKIKKLESNDNVGKLDKSIEHKQEQINELVPIYNYEARKLEEQSIGEEAAKLKNIDDAQELVRMLKDAIKEGNKPMVKAAMRQLTEQYNDNEATEALVGDSSYQGLQKLMRALAGKKYKDEDGNEVERKDLKAGFSEQEAFRLGAQIAEMNKRTSHWEATAAYIMDNGRFREATQREHVLIASTELGKRGPQSNMRDNNRLASGKHIINKYGVKVWQPVDIGLIQLQSFDNGRMIGRLAENMTESSAKYYAQIIDRISGIDGLISTALIDAVKDKAGISTYQGAQFDSIASVLRTMNK